MLNVNAKRDHGTLDVVTAAFYACKTKIMIKTNKRNLTNYHSKSKTKGRVIILITCKYIEFFNSTAPNKRKTPLL